MPAQKLRKDGTPKRSGLQEGDRRMGRALSLKLQVVDEQGVIIHRISARIMYNTYYVLYYTYYCILYFPTLGWPLNERYTIVDTRDSRHCQSQFVTEFGHRRC